MYFHKKIYIKGGDIISDKEIILQTVKTMEDNKTYEEIMYELIVLLQKEGCNAKYGRFSSFC